MLFAEFSRRVKLFPGATFAVKFRVKRCFSVGGALFARAGAVDEERPAYGFKAGPAFDGLIESGVARRMPYLGRARWVELVGNDALPDDTLMEYVAASYRLVFAKLPRATRAAIEGDPRGDRPLVEGAGGKASRSSP